jgi:hypothetical protein
MPADREAAFWPLSIGFAVLTAPFLVDWIAHGDLSSLHLWLTAIAIAGLLGTWAPPSRLSRLAYLVALVGAVASLILGSFLFWSGQAVEEGWRATWIDVAISVAILAQLGWSAVRKRSKTAAGESR